MEFLRKTAGYLFEKYAENFSQINIILPNRRAGVFLKKYLSEQITKPVFLPRITSIQDFVIELSGVSLADDFTSLVELYKSYSAVKSIETETFDEFLHWGNKLLQDFDEIDQHLADAEYIFSYLNEDKNLALWALDNKPLSEFQQNYLEFYGMLLSIYLDFSERMNNIGLATYGMACRKLATMLTDSDEQINTYSTVVFAGLNALNASEEYIINRFYEKGKAEILWDGDEYYINDTTQEAGNFIRKYKGRWNINEPKWIGTDLLSQEKNITLVAVAGKIGQIKYTAGEINKLLKENVSSEQISVVMNEEILLIPMLNSIPDEIDKFNITMGYPMRLSSAYSFIEIIFSMHENAERFRSVKNAKELLFYYNDLQKLFNHHFFYTALGGNHNLFSQLTRQERIFYTRSEVLYLLSKSIDIIPEAVVNLFVPWKQQSAKAIDCLSAFIIFIKDSIYAKRGLDAEFLYSVYKILMRIKTVCETADIKLTPKTLHLMFSQHVSQTAVPFIGEPLNGLQVMGMLETRTLDFDTVFMLSVNENVLPKGKIGNSFIPHGIRIDSGLPTYKQNEEIFAYHFYRILQRSKNIYLIYNTQSDDMGGGERSRFINQIVYELPKKNPGIKIEEEFVTFPPEKNIKEKIIIKKDNEIISRLEEIAASGLSPSALNVYRKCSLQYYFSYIIRIKENEEISETIDSREFGDHIHVVLERLFETCVSQELTKDIINDFLKSYEIILKENFEKESQNSFDGLNGKNLLIYNVIKDYIRYFLEKEIEIINDDKENNIKRKVLFIEKKLYQEIEISITNITKKINLKGKVDRIDQIGDGIQVIDYKSGEVKNKNFDFDKLLNDSQDFKNDYSFQVLLYLWLFAKENEKNIYSSLQSGVWSFRNIDEGVKNVFYYAISGEKKSKTISFGPEQLVEFEKILNNLLVRLFDPSEDFIQTQNEDNCDFCPYALMCGK